MSWHWVSHIFGLDSAASPFYLFWSGSGGLATTLIAAMLMALRWLRCDERGCWHLGRLQVPDSVLVVCRQHWHAGQLAREHKASGGGTSVDP
jgi:hypothetical protein